MAEYKVAVGYTSDSMVYLPFGTVDALRSRLQRMARDKNTNAKARFRFPFDQVGMPDIREMMQLWAGWQEGFTWLQEPDPPTLAYIMAQDGGQWGSEHEILCDVYPLSCLAVRCTVVGWPTGEETGLPTAGMPAGLSIADWLAGTAGTGGMPQDGVVRYYCPNMDYSGIAPYFSSLILDAASMPGGNTNGGIGGSLIGQYGFTDLETILNDLVGVARYKAAQAGETIEPIYFWDTVADGDRLRPRFNFIDNLDVTGTRKARLAANPRPGDVPLRNARHKRDARQVRTDVVITNGSGDGAGNVVMTRYQAHLTDYPAEYLRNGWGGKPWIVTEIPDQATCDKAARAVGSRIWGAIGTLTTETDGRTADRTAWVQFQPGDTVGWDDVAEGQTDASYIVRAVEPATTPGDVTVTVGDIAPDATDLIRGATIMRPLQTSGTGSGGGAVAGNLLSAYGTPGAPPKIAVDRTPMHSQQNRIVPGFNDSVGLTLQGNAQDRDPINPVDPASYAHPFQVKSPATALVPDPAPGLWSSHDSEAHPYTVDFGYIATDGTYATHVDYPMSMRRLSIKGTGTVTLQREGSDVAGPYSVSAAWKNLLISADFLAGEDLGVVVSGTSGTGVSVKVKEREDTVVP